MKKKRVAVESPFLTVPQAARWANVSESLIYKACKSKTLRHYRPGLKGGRVAIAVEDLRGWMAGFVVDAVSTAGEDDKKEFNFV